MDAWLVTLIGALALVVSAIGGSALTVAVLHLAAHSEEAWQDGEAGPGRPDRRRPDAAAVPDGEPGVPHPHDDDPVGRRSREVLRGGTWIGVLERLAITGALLVGYPAGIAFVIAIKGLGRYPELRENPEASERFVIGTLASMLWAVAVGGAVRILLLG